MIRGLRRLESRLTGRARARPGWFGKQVLQVELQIFARETCPPPPGTTSQEWADLHPPEPVDFRWRDATWQDVASLIPPQR